MRWRSGETWWLNEEEERAQEEKVAERFAEDTWAGVIREFTADRKTGVGVSVAEIMTQALRKPTERWTLTDQMRIGRTLVAEGWTRRRVTVEKETSGVKTTRREWRYYFKEIKPVDITVKAPKPTTPGIVLPFAMRAPV